MEDAIDAGYTKLALQHINRVRLSLQVECLLDLCDAEGKKMMNEATSASQIRWPHQLSPRPKSWKVWKKFLRNYTVG